MTAVTRPSDCSTEQIWAVLADGWTYGSWVVGAARIREVDLDWPGPGSVIHHSVGSWPLLVDDTTSVLESDPGRRLMLRARAWPVGEATVEITLDTTDKGTDVTMWEDATAGPGTLVPQVVRGPVIAQRNTESLRRLVLLARGRQG
jgi:hypothetical protein